MITPSQIPNPYVKPKWQASVGVMESVVAYNCRKYGMPRPVLAMPMWEGAGSRVLDLSGHGNHGDLSNPDWVAEGLDFVAANSDYVDCGDINALDGISALTVYINLKTTMDGGGGLVGKDVISVNPNDHTWLLYKSSGTDCANFYVAKASPSVWDAYITGSTQIHDGLWHQICGVYDGSNDLKLFVDGKSEGSIVGTEPATLRSNSHSVKFGVYSATSYFDGAIAEAIVFNTALSAAQIKFLSDDPYFMYRMPEELYGYTSAAPPPVSIPVFMHHYNQLRGA